MFSLTATARRFKYSMKNVRNHREFVWLVGL